MGPATRETRLQRVVERRSNLSLVFRDLSLICSEIREEDITIVQDGVWVGMSPSPIGEFGKRNNSRVLVVAT